MMIGTRLRSAGLRRWSIALLLAASGWLAWNARGRAEALRQIKERCLALAPPPAPDWDAATPVG